MPTLYYLSLSKSDFDNTNWESVIANIAQKNCEKYYSEFFGRALEAKTQGNQIYEEVFTLLGAVSSMLLRPSAGRIYEPLFVFYDPPSRGFVLDDLSDDHIAVLAEVASDTSDAEMRARLADIVWVKGRSRYYHLVAIAVDAYLDSAKNMLAASGPLSPFIDRLERAVSLANMIRNRPLLDRVLGDVEKIIFAQNVDDTKFPFAILIRRLLEYPLTNFAAFCSLLETLAQKSENKGDWSNAQVYWQIKSSLDVQMGDTNNQRLSLIQAAQAHVKVGEIYATNEQPNYGAATFQLLKAIEILRSIGGMQSRSQEIHKILLVYQKSSISDFAHASFPVDISLYVQQARQSVKGKPFFEALMTLAFIELPTNKHDLRQQVEDYFKDTPFQAFFSATMVDSEGRQTAFSPSYLDPNDDNKEIAIRARMYMEAARHQEILSITIIEPMIHQILLDHQVQIDDLVFLVQYNAFIPPEQGYIFLKGLYSGFQFDFLVAGHLLIPQIENSLRYILNQGGVVTSSLNTQTGIQENFTLDTLLEMPDLEKILGEDIIFDLQGLLVGRFGSNLRNRLSHGMLPAAAFSSRIMIYFWWLTLRLICGGSQFVQAMSQSTKSEEDDLN